VLYNLDKLPKAPQVFVVEGEKAAEAVANLGLVSTTSAHGANSPGRSDWTPLAGKDVVILPDHDTEGESYAGKVTRLLAQLEPEPTVRIVLLESIWRTEKPVPEGGDVADWLRVGVPEGWDENQCRQELERVVAEATPVELTRSQVSTSSPQPESTSSLRPLFSNCSTSQAEGESVVQPLPISDIHERLSQAITPGWPKRVGETLFTQTPSYEPVYLDSSNRLFAYIHASAQVDWKGGSGLVTKDQFYEYLRISAEKYDAIENCPHWPPLHGIYYMHPPVPEQAGIGKLDELVRFFYTLLTDRALIKSLILTLFWGGSPGSRPAFLIMGPDDDPEQGRGVGKSRLVDILSEELVGGSIDVCPTDSIAGVKTRLLSNEEGRKRVARLDNVKTHRFSWADLEGLITSSTISGRALYKGEGRRPNTLIWMITLNGASLSKDMAQRVIPIKLWRPDFDPMWESKVRTFIRKHRWELLAEIKSILEQPVTDMTPSTRWAAWEQDVLCKVDGYEELQAVILDRQGSMDDDEDERSLLIYAIREQIQNQGFDPDTDQVLIPSQVLAYWVTLATRVRYPTNRASAFIASLSIPNLRKSDRNGQRLWLWTGDGYEGGEAKLVGSAQTSYSPLPEFDLSGL
jgi:hypothetical protein